MSLAYLILIVLMIQLLAAEKPQLVCLPKLGCLQGTTMPGYRTGKFEAYLGIPYAKPPVGNLRFANPVAVEPWKGIIDATQAKPDCIQKNYLLPVPELTGVEDCLYLNIYRPITQSEIPLPVMFYIFGGGFFSGSANPLIHGAEYFMDTNRVILVTLSYRLGALGFLSTGDENCPGNFALKDQNIALKWVQNNIQEFGGNPKSVTIFGQSAGGASAHMHMLSPLSKGLFHRAIVMSGNAGAAYNNIVQEPLLQARKQAKYVGISNYDHLSPSDLINALREIDAVTLVDSGDKFKYWHVDPLTTFRPVIEANKSDSFLVENPIITLNKGNFNHVPWMTGFVPFEGAVRALSIVSNETLRNDFNKKFDKLLSKLMVLQAPSERRMNEKLDKLTKFYLNGEHMITAENAHRFIDMITDRAFLYPLYKTVSSYVTYANTILNPVYLYKFNYRGPYSYSVLFSGTLTDYGVVHCDDLIYLFKSPALFPKDFDHNSTEAIVIKVLVETYVTFATTGKQKKWTYLHPCNQRSFNSFEKHQNSFCDYQEFRNSKTNPHKFEIISNDYFNVDVVKFWEGIISKS